MSCPNVNHPDWIKLVDTVGEARAWQIFIENNNEVPPAQETREKYFENVKVVGFNPEELMAVDDAEVVLNKLSAITGIEWKWNKNLPYAGQFNAIGGVEINPIAVTKDAPWHEFLHPLVEVLSVENVELFEHFKSILNTTPQGKYVRAQVLKEYPHKENSEIFYKEAVTTLLGFAAAKEFNNKDTSLWERFKNWAKTIFYRAFGMYVDLSTLNSNMSMSQFTRQLLVTGNKKILTPYSSTVTQNMINHLIERNAIDKDLNIKDIQSLTKELAFINHNWPGAISLSTDGKKIEFQTMLKVGNIYNEGGYEKSTEDSDVYENSEGKKLDAVGKRLRQHSPNPEVREMNDLEFKSHIVDLQVEAKFKNSLSNEIPIIIDNTLEMMSKEQYASYLRDKNEEYLNKGKAYHKASEMLFLLLKNYDLQNAGVGAYSDEMDSNSKKIQELRSKIDELTGGEYQSVYNMIIRPFIDQSNNTLDINGISSVYGMIPGTSDEAFSERVLTNEELGIGGTADVFIEHSNGMASIKDIKTGASIANQRTTGALFKGTDQVIASPENYAKLQLAYYAFLAKAKDRTLKFKDIEILYFEFENQTHKIKVDLAQYLPIIQKELESQGKEEWVKKNQDLFNHNNYRGIDVAQEELKKISGLNAEELEAYMLRELKGYTKGGDLSGVKFEGRTREEIAKIVTAFKNYMRIAAGSIYNLEDSRDMSAIYQKFGDLLNVSNERLQAFSKIFYAAYSRYWDEMFTTTRKHDRLLQDVLKEGPTVLPMSLLKQDPKRVVGFMWKQEGEQWRLIEENDAEYKTQVNTKAKKAYHKFYIETIQNKFKEATSDQQKLLLQRKYPMLVKQDNVITPYVPMDREDSMSIEGIKRKFITRDDGVKRTFKESAARLLGASEDIDSGQHQQGVSVNYLGYRDDHTFDTELMFYKTMENMVWKKQMDSVYGIGKVLAAIMRDQKDVKENPVQKNNLEFLEGKLQMLILKEPKKDMAGIDINVTTPDGVNKKLTVTADDFLDTLRKWTTLSIMPLRFVLMFRNWYMEMHFNAINAIKGSISKRVSWVKNKKYIDYSTKDFMKANLIMFQSIYDPKVRKKKKAIMQKYKLSIDFNYDFDTTRRKLSNSILKEKFFYITSQVGESFSAEVAALSAMVHDGMWEKHDENANYTGPKRGVVLVDTIDGKKIYKDLYGYESEEIRRLREVVKKIHGTYSEDQKANIEGRALGRLAMQFQKYKVNYLEKTFLKAYNNDALGRFVTQGKTAEGEEIFGWERQIDEGVLKTAFRTLAIFSPNGLDLLNNKEAQNKLGLSDIQKMNLIEMGTTLTLWLIALAGIAFAFDPDDDDRNKRNFLYKNLMRLKDDILYAYSPRSILIESKNPVIGMALLSDALNDIDLLLSMERYKNSSKRYGYEKGDLKFMHKVKRRYIPFASTYKEIQAVGGLFGLDVGYEYKFNDIKVRPGYEPGEMFKWLAK